MTPANFAIQIMSCQRPQVYYAYKPLDAYGTTSCSNKIALTRNRSNVSTVC